MFCRWVAERGTAGAEEGNDGAVGKDGERRPRIASDELKVFSLHAC